ncbi:MAG: hypothetical protein ACO1OB_30220 [Archangium sp.]
MRFMILPALMLCGCAVTPRVVMQPTTSEDGEVSVDVDVALRATLEKCGAKVVESPENANVVLMPRIEADGDVTSLHVTGMKAGSQQLLGNFSLTAKGASRERRVKALMGRVCNEAQALMQSDGSATRVALAH